MLFAIDIVGLQVACVAPLARTGRPPLWRTASILLPPVGTIGTLARLRRRG